MSAVRRAKDPSRVANNMYPLPCIQLPEDHHFAFLTRSETTSPYGAGLWVTVWHFGEKYPFKSPSVGFRVPPFHPNIEFSKGSICLSTLKDSVDAGSEKTDSWRPIHRPEGILATDLPQLLSNPVPSDPLCTDAARVMETNLTEYVDRCTASASRGMVKAFVSELGFGHLWLENL